MDFVSLLSAIPGLAHYAPIVALVGYACAAMAPGLAPPTATSSAAYRAVHRAVNLIALNFGHAKNAS